MNVRSLLLIVIAVAIAAAAAMFARSLVGDQPAAAPVISTAAPADAVKILVAANALPVGRLMEAKDYGWKAWPKDGVDDRYVREEGFDPQSLVGKVVRHSMVAGEPVTMSKLVGPGERGFLAAILSPGMRAITVPINQTSGIAGFIFPGDRVDIILSHAIEDAKGSRRKVSETVLYNVRILAVDQRTDDQTNKPALGQTVTLEVTPKIAEAISVLRELGDLSLSLRSLALNEDKDGPSVNHQFFASRPSYTWDSDVSALLPDVSQRNMLTVSRGAETASVAFGGQ
ncbi:MAG: Flp pilus assembly protein CpaB [Pseudomonadota bacterium]